MISYDLWTKKQLIERLMHLEKDLLKMKKDNLDERYEKNKCICSICTMKDEDNPYEDVSDLVMEDHERKLRDREKKSS